MCSISKKGQDNDIYQQEQEDQLYAMYLWQVDEDLHALVWPHVCDMAEVGRRRNDPRPPVTPAK